MVAAVAIGSAVVGGVAANMAAGEQADGARDAAGMSAQATRESVAEQRRQYNQSRTDLAPYRETGTNALAQYAALYGIGRNPMTERTSYLEGELSDLDARPGAWGDPGRQAQQRTLLEGELQSARDQAGSGTLSTEEMQAARDRFMETPGYQFRFDEGTRALDRSAAARGGLRGGAFARELTRYGQGIASAEFGNYADRLAGIAGMGQGATTATATLGQQTAAGIGNTLMTGAGQQGNAIQNAATARASGYAGVGNAVTGAAQNYMFMNAMQNQPTSYNTMYGP